MNFTTYLDKSWDDHATQSALVAEGFNQGLKLVESNEQLAQLTGIVTHVMGEHLGRWTDGVALLNEFKNHPFFISRTETDKAVLRSIAALEVASGQATSLVTFTQSDQIRIFAVAASAVSERSSDQARNFLQKSLQLAETGTEKNDPANRALAIAGNNLACALEEKKSRNAVETELMILAAKTGRKYWELAGTWLEVATAEYRLAMTYIQANAPEKAFYHSQTNIEILRENSAGSRNLFFGYQALALSEKQRGNELGFKTAVDQAKQFFAKLSDADKTYCEPGMKTLGIRIAD